MAQGSNKFAKKNTRNNSSLYAFSCAFGHAIDQHTHIRKDCVKEERNYCLINVNSTQKMPAFFKLFKCTFILLKQK